MTCDSLYVIFQLYSAYEGNERCMRAVFTNLDDAVKYMFTIHYPNREVGPQFVIDEYKNNDEYVKTITYVNNNFYEFIGKPNYLYNLSQRCTDKTTYLHPNLEWWKTIRKHNYKKEYEFKNIGEDIDSSDDDDDLSH